MSETNGEKAGPEQAATIREVQGVFPDDATMQGALSQLTLAGYDRADFSLPEEQDANQVATPNEGAEPATDDTDKRQLRTMGASMAGYAGAVAAAGATLATGGAAGLAVAAAGALLGGERARVLRDHQWKLLRGLVLDVRKMEGAGFRPRRRLGDLVPAAGAIG